jgi:lipoprotein-anchoring transpeptidase ErfK/SrfK
MAGIDFDLPGVPWCTYFHWNGSALHGAYWHNDYGRPRSHGCLNLRPEDAKWLYRWTQPAVPPEQVVLREAGTPVVIG